MKKKKKEYASFTEYGKKYMQCKCCHNYTIVDNDAIAITCSSCVTIKSLQLMPIEEMVSFLRKKKSSGKPPGWHFMNEFVDKDGNVFHKGKEQPDLKGTLKPTKVKPPKKRKKKDPDKKMFDLAKKYKKKLKLKRKSK